MHKKIRLLPLAGTDEVYIRLTANADTKEDCHDLIAPVKDEILARIGEYYYVLMIFL